MIIGIDIRVLASGRKTGIEEYTSNLLSFLLPLGLSRGIQYKLFYNGFKKVKLEYDWLRLSNVKLIKSRIPNRILNLLVSLIRWPKIDKFLGEVDVFFSPHFLPVAVLKNHKQVITFHDLSFKHHPQFFSIARRVWHSLVFPKQQVKIADKIIVDSCSTKEDLIKIYKIKPEKIKVVYLGLKKHFQLLEKNNKFKFNQIRKKYNLPESFILYFGTIEPRKNLISVINAFQQLKDEFSDSHPEIIQKKLDGLFENKNKFKDLKLVIAGSNGWLYKDIFETAKASKYREDIIFTGSFADKDKPYLYNLATAFVYPSFFEGFGFPPLEAMACGVPTVVSNTSSLPEVVGKGAIMIDPYNVDELSFSLKSILENKNLREGLIKEGLKQAKKFDWNKTARQVLNILQNC